MHPLARSSSQASPYLVRRSTNGLGSANFRSRSYADATGPRWLSSDGAFQEHDVVLLRQRGHKRAKWRLTPPLQSGRRVKLAYGATVAADDLLGRNPLETVYDSKGRDLVVHEASMTSYVLHSERLATPIYPPDASAIVSMLDLHPERPEENENGDSEPFEVFEAGTGQASLTLHLARALHAANPPMPRELRDAIVKAVRPRPERDVQGLTQPGEAQLEGGSTVAAASEEGSQGAEAINTSASDSASISASVPEVETSSAVAPEATAEATRKANPEVIAEASPEASPETTPETPSEDSSPSFQTLALKDTLPLPSSLHPLLSQHLSSRRAIIHTLDHNPRHALHAQRLVRRFRRAQYLTDIDFHTGSIHAYITSRLSSRPKNSQPFLHRAVLDLPAGHDDDIAGPVIRALRPNGLLVVFNPSVSQIATFVKRWADAAVRRHLADKTGDKYETPDLRLERIVELPNSFVHDVSDPRLGDGMPGRPWDVRTVMPRVRERQRQRSSTSAGSEVTDDVDVSTSAGSDELVQVMRPMVGDRVAGGGFVALLRKWPSEAVIGGQSLPAEDVETDEEAVV